VFNIGAGEAALIGLVAIVVLGPDRLPKAAADVGRVLRHLRNVAQDAKAELTAELGPEVTELRSLDPRKLIRDQLLGNDDVAPVGRGRGQIGPPPWDPDAT
jgi:sec-independent protein translocase protein TatB